MPSRPYQNVAAKKLFDCFNRGTRSALLVMATGLGKTWVFTDVANQWPGQSRVLVLSERRKLVKQAANAAEVITGTSADVFMGGAKSTGGLFSDSRIVSASVQSLCRSLDEFNPHEFGLVVWDEAHHCVPKNKMYWAIREHFRKNPGLCELGATATPRRGDKKGLGNWFDENPYSYPLVPAIQDGWLCPVDQQVVHLKDLNLSAVTTATASDGERDLAQKQLQKAMGVDDVVLAVAADTVKYAGDKPTLVFCAGVEQAESIADEINGRHRSGCAVALHGGTPYDVQEEQLGRFERREFQFLIGCDLFIEGFDLDTIGCLAIAKPTKSLSRYLQMLGRGTRTLKGVLSPDLYECHAAERLAAIARSAKPSCLVLDFVGQSGRHQLVSAADALAGEYCKPAAIKAAFDAAKKHGQPVRIDAALADMQKRIEEAERKKAERKAREEAERRAEIDRLVELANMNRVKVEADSYLEPMPIGGHEAADDFSAEFRRGIELATAKQKAFLTKHGRYKNGMSKAEASREIGKLKSEWTGATCTEKQAKLLASHGESAKATKEHASLLIDLLASRGWQSRDYRLTPERWCMRVVDGQYLPVVNDPMAGKVVVSKRPFASEQACREFITRHLEQA